MEITCTEIVAINFNISELTQREQEVLALIGRGYSIPKIAEKLYRSQKTIETHRQSLGRKLGASNRVELARIAIQVGLAPLEVDASNLAGYLPGAQAIDPRGHYVDNAPELKAVQRIDSACATAVDVAYVRKLCEVLVEVLGVSGVGLFSSEESLANLRSVVLYYRGEWLAEKTLPLEITPCAETIRKGFFLCKGQLNDVCPEFSREFFPDARSYLGVRLEDAVTGEPLGTLTVLMDGDEPFAPIVEPVVRYCAVRAAAELGRMQLIDSLQRSVETLEQRLALYEPHEDGAG
ncbi:MAG: LuxR C-terminal-related transcriptional regulator [Planctomycetota bacterium]